MLFSAFKDEAMRSSVDSMSQEQIKAEKRGILKNVFLISFAFLLLFTAFQSMSALQSSINKASITPGPFFFLDMLLWTPSLTAARDLYDIPVRRGSGFCQDRNKKFLPYMTGLQLGHDIERGHLCCSSGVLHVLAQLRHQEADG